MTPSTVRLQAIIDILNRIAPFSFAEDWDNVGLMIGDPDQEITGILAALDPTIALLTEAQEVNANLIITHHPIIFHPLKNIQLDQPESAFIAKSIINGIAVAACHTNLDIVQNGVNEALARQIDLIDYAPLIPPSAPPPAIGLGLSGTLRQPLRADAFFSGVCKVLDLPAINITGPIPEIIERVAICGGSGSELAAAAQKSGAQVYITGEVKHSTARWAEDAGYCIADAGHFGTENVIVAELVKLLMHKLGSLNIKIPVQASRKQKRPFTLFLSQ